LKLKPLPEKDPTKGMLPIRSFPHVRVVGLGIREDKDISIEKDGSTHEAL